MTIDFVNLVKGRVTQTLLMALLERGGYRVTRFGIEEVLEEVKYLDLPEYRRLGLPMQLRSLPDLLVVELDMSHAFLVEVKYRKRFDDRSAVSLHRDLTVQLEAWPSTHTVLMISEPFGEDLSCHQDYIRVICPADPDLLVENELPPQDRWNKLHHVQRVFTRFNDPKIIEEVQQSADRLTAGLKDLANL